MNYLKDLPATSNNNYPLANCSDPSSHSSSGGSSSTPPPLTTVPRNQCCNWDTWKWAEYTAKRQCCGVDGVKPLGTC